MRKMRFIAIVAVFVILVSMMDALAQTRVHFARGRTSTSVKGTIGGMGERDFILRAVAGQNLSANVGSSGGCIQFSTVSTSADFTTEDGDNWLKLMNMCRRPASKIWRGPSGYER